MPKLEQTPDPIKILENLLCASSVKGLRLDTLVHTAAAEEEVAIAIATEQAPPGAWPTTSRFYVYRHITLEEQDRALVIHLNNTPESREEVESLYNKPTTHALAELFEEATSNGWDWIYPDEIDSMTEAPILGIGIIRDAKGILLGVDRVYWHSGYQTEDPIRELCDQGKVSFLRSPTREIFCDDTRVNDRLVAAGVYRDENGLLVAPDGLDLQGLDNASVPVARVMGLLNVRDTTGLSFPDLTFAEGLDGSYSKDLDVSALEVVEEWVALKGVNDARVGGLRSVGTHLLVEATEGLCFDDLETVGVILDALFSKGLRLPKLREAGVGVFSYSDQLGGEAPYTPLLKDPTTNYRSDD